MSGSCSDDGDITNDGEFEGDNLLSYFDKLNGSHSESNYDHNYCRQIECVIDKSPVVCLKKGYTDSKSKIKDDNVLTSTVHTSECYTDFKDKNTKKTDQYFERNLQQSDNNDDDDDDSGDVDDDDDDSYLKDYSNQIRSDEDNKNMKKHFVNSRIRNWPWIDSSLYDMINRCCLPMTPYIEERMIKKLSDSIKNASNCNIRVPTSVFLLRRKLYVRKLKREHNIKTFSFDKHLKADGIKHCENCYQNGKLDRCSNNVNCEDVLPRLTILLEGPYPDLSFVVSSYTNRYLKPFIWCDAETEPPWLKILHQIRNSPIINNKKQSCDDRYSDSGNFSLIYKNCHRPPICYSYIKAGHVNAINDLCSVYFWPGVDVSECLQYPDFSCVASYKKLIVGFALMVPDVTITDCYISFLLTRPGWRGSGIATFMLYHLIQTCMGKDITLHVSVDNPALFLYQRFGFKVEKFVQNFYEKYLPLRSNQCRHALFLRLSR